MDTSIKIPLINKTIGLDPLLGLIPGGGDTATALMSLYIMVVAIRLETPLPVLLKMGINILVDFGVGVVPIVGDVIDAMWKSNLKNIYLLEQAFLMYGHPTQAKPVFSTNQDNHPVIEIKAES
jgi:hypothetical protein